MDALAAKARSARRLMLALFALSALSVVGGLVAVIVLGGSGVAQVEAAVERDAQGRIAVRFTNSGTRQGFLCVWINQRCPGREKQTVHLCSDDVSPTDQVTVTTRLQAAGAAGCRVTLVRDDAINL